MYEGLKERVRFLAICIYYCVKTLAIASLFWIITISLMIGIKSLWDFIYG